MRETKACAPPAGAALDGIVAVLREAHGLDVSRYGESFLARSLERRRDRVSCGTDAAYRERLLADRAEAEAFLRSLRVGYSEFFRDPLAFALLERAILPALAAERSRGGRGELRVWSAGCAAGQEAWSAAILLDELSAAQAGPVPYRVFATDICEPDLETARAGVYGAEAIGNVRARHLRECFFRPGRGPVKDTALLLDSPERTLFPVPDGKSADSPFGKGGKRGFEPDDSHAIVPRIRERVDFSLHDLLDERTTSPPAGIYGEFDLVLCCNVLLYYRPEAQRTIMDKLRDSLAPGGYLVTDEAERQIVESAGGLRAVTLPAAVFRNVVRRS